MLSNDLKKQAKARESVLVVFVILAMCYAGYSTFYAPKKKLAVDLVKQLEEIIEKKSGIEKLNAALKEKYEQQAKELKSQAQMEASLDPKVKMIKDYENSLFKNISEFLNYVTQGEFVSNVDITSMKYDTATIRTGYTLTKFYLNSSGRFSDITDFIDRLEGVPALISIDKLNLNVGSKEANKVNLDLEGTFYELQRENQ